MAKREGELIVQVVIEELDAPPKFPNSFLEEWIHILPGSTNVKNANHLDFKDPYASCIDVEVLDRNGYELFWYFHNNRTLEVPICNPWIRNLSKLIMLEVFLDVDLINTLIKYYNLVNKSFHKRDRWIFLSLDKETFIEAFELGGPMSLPIEIEKLKKNFTKHKTFYMGRNMTRHIPSVKKNMGEISKKR